MRALITGVTGQDGAYLSAFLLKKGYEVFGTYRRLSTPNFWRLQALGVLDKLTLIPLELMDESSAVEAVRVSDPDEVYHLAAQSFVGASFEQPLGTGDVTGLGTARILEAVRQVRPRAKFYNAASSELFGDRTDGAQDEGTPMMPASPYAAAKLYSYHMVRIYREAYGMFATNGILFNHESPLRGIEFVTRKITNAVARIKLGLQSEIALGNLEARRDWGWAEEYVEGMWRMLQLDMPDDYVVATGIDHSVKEFAEAAFDVVGLDWKNHVRVNEKYKRPLEVWYHRGDATKSMDALGWYPRRSFEGLVENMVDADVKRWRQYLDGKYFPWDAYNYADEAIIVTKRGMER